VQRALLMAAIALAGGCDPAAEPPPTVSTHSPAPVPSNLESDRSLVKPIDAPPLVLEGPSCHIWTPERGTFDPGRDTLGLGRSGECYFASIYAGYPRFACHAEAEGACRGGVGECGGVGDGLSVWFVTQNGPGTCRLTFRFTNQYRETATAAVEFAVGPR
jgi:hypothetical protein